MHGASRVQLRDQCSALTRCSLAGRCEREPLPLLLTATPTDRIDGGSSVDSTRSSRSHRRSLSLLSLTLADCELHRPVRLRAALASRISPPAAEPPPLPPSAASACPLSSCATMPSASCAKTSLVVTAVVGLVIFFFSLTMFFVFPELVASKVKKVRGRDGSDTGLVGEI